MATKTYKGACHCGAVTIEANIDISAGTQKCNCTYCHKARSWKAFVKPPAFRWLSGEDKVSAYRTNEFTAKKYHCKGCGMFTHEHGNAEWMGGEFVGIQIAVLENVDQDELANAPITVADGFHNNWMETPADVRNL
ncbi:MAG: GFA family protein [Candidatus Pacebacteria bacterium]|nr:GFA family protein [Candidatus Paceibacterota bacterium]